MKKKSISIILATIMISGCLSRPKNLPLYRWQADGSMRCQYPPGSTRIDGDCTKRKSD